MMTDTPPFLNHPLFDQVRSLIPPKTEVYLVGGAIRDAFVGKPIHDLDFVLKKDPRSLARQVANQLGGAYYLMDDERQTARVVLRDGNSCSSTIDFARFRGVTLEEDLRGRDFTINAMAIPVHSPNQLLDPLQGFADLRYKRLRACSPESMKDDPLRVLRGIRIALAFNLQIVPETFDLMKQAAPKLERVSIERRRDELFRIFEANHPASAVRMLDIVGALSQVLPELLTLKNVKQSPPHTLDVWEHTLATVQRLEDILGVLAPGSDPEKSDNLAFGLLQSQLGRYRQKITEQLNQQISPGRYIRSLLVLAALYHDIAKPNTWSQDESGRIHNYKHEDIGSDIIIDVGKRLQLSNDEIDYLRIVVRNHMRIHLLAQKREVPSRRAIYRFFRDTGSPGIEVCLLTLADTLATYGMPVDVEVWKAHLEVCQALMECWFEKPTETIHPPILINGHDLQDEFQLKPGPVIGQLLEALREAQAEGEIHDRQEALQFARSWFSENIRR